MKKLITLIAIMVLTLSSFAQTAKVEGTAADLKKNISANFIEFVMPSEVTAENIEKSAQYYTDYFTVGFNKESKVAKITLLKGEEIERRVITRFLLSTGVRGVNFEGTDYTIMEFYSNFLE